MFRDQWYGCRLGVVGRLLVAATGIAVAATGLGRPVLAAGKQAFNVAGTFLEGCSCPAPCPCEMLGLKMGCEGVGAVMLTTGTYEGVDLKGVKIAYATVPAHWVRVYVDGTAAQQGAAAAFATGVYSAFGKIESAKPAKITLTGANGHYTLMVDNGKIMRLTTTPVLGGDKKTPIGHTNLADPLNPTVYQGKTVSASYRDGAHHFTLSGSNSFFNNHMQATGQI